MYLNLDLVFDAIALHAVAFHIRWECDSVV